MSETKQEATQPKIKVYEYADFHIKCHTCGHDEVAIANVKGGLRTELFTTDQHKFVMECKQCGAKLEYYFTEAVNPPEPEEEEVIPPEVAKPEEAVKVEEVEKTEKNDTNEEVQSQAEEADEVQAEVEEEPQIDAGVMDGPVDEPK